MLESLQEFVDSRGVDLRVDRRTGVLRGVKLLGLESLNGRRYRGESLATAVGLYEGAKVNVNHAKAGPLAPRDYQDRLGVVRQVEYRPGAGLFGNLHYNPKHALAEQLAWDAENNPGNVGLSHNVQARVVRDNGVSVVEAITRVHSIDLVADPATTSGLFEHAVAGAPELLDGSNDAADALGESTGVASDGADALTRAGDFEQSVPSATEDDESNDRSRRLLVILESALATGLLEKVLPAPRVEEQIAAACGPALFQELLSAADDRQVDSLLRRRQSTVQSRVSESAIPSATEKPTAVEQRRTSGRVGGRVGSVLDFVKAVRGGTLPVRP